jgi:hypothetical protein
MWLEIYLLVLQECHETEWITNNNLIYTRLKIIIKKTNMKL